MRKKSETLREELLQHTREMIETEGTDAVTMRGLAIRAGVSTGTVYNYFASKNEVLLTLTDEYWAKTLSEIRSAVSDDTFVEQIAYLYQFLHSRIDHSGGMFMGILRHVEPAAHEQMANAQAKLREILVTRLQQDPCIHEEVWDGPLTREQFADFVLTNLMIHLQREDDCIQPFLDILNRILY